MAVPTFNSAGGAGLTASGTSVAPFLPTRSTGDKLEEVSIKQLTQYEILPIKVINVLELTGNLFKEILCQHIQ